MIGISNSYFQFSLLIGLVGLLILPQISFSQDTIFYDGDTIRVGELEWDMEKDYKGRGELLSGNEELYGEKIKIFLVYHKNKMVEQILFGYVEGEAFVPHGPARYYYDSGHLLGKRYFVEGNLEGKAEDFFKSGKVSMRTHFHENQFQGEFATYYENGELDQQGYYHQDTLVGEFRSFYNNGQRQWIEYYDSTGLKQGRDSTFFETGTLESVCEFKDDVEDGDAIFFHRNGRTWSRRSYLNGRLREVKFIKDAKGKELSVGSFSNGNGWVNVYNDSGVLIEKERFKNGLLVKVKRVRKR